MIGIVLAIVVILTAVGVTWWRIRTQNQPFLPDDWSQMILEAGNQSGRPKGLIWSRCQPNGVTVASAKGLTLYAPYEIQFSTIPGSDMDGIEAATIPRPVVVVFHRHGKSWRIARPPVFNFTPDHLCALEDQNRKNQ
jgi:hypothetical protein